MIHKAETAQEVLFDDHRQLKTSVFEGSVQSVITQVFAECRSGYTVGKT